MNFIIKIIESSTLCILVMNDVCCFFVVCRNKINEKQCGKKKKEDKESSIEMLDGIITDADTVGIVLLLLFVVSHINL